MTASEFAFLALGLVLGVAAGAALVEVARSRPPAKREVRVTVSPNSIRPRASTLAEESPDTDESGVARGGPADHGADERSEAAAATVDAPPNRTPVPYVLQPAYVSAGSASLPPRSGVAAPPPADSARASEGISIAREVDPMMAALRGSAVTELATAGRTGTMERGTAAVTPASGDGSNWGNPMTFDTTRASSSAAGDSAGADVAGSAATGAATDSSADSRHADSGPCADLRRVADERCAVATRARDGARMAAEGHRAAQREYDDHVGRAESEASVADPRSVRAAKEAAQAAFRAARSAATTRDGVETAARDWLTEINRINVSTRDAGGRAEYHRAAAAELGPALERLAVEADAARISAESAEEACVAAREAVASCEEAAANAAAAAATRRAGVVTPDAPESAESETEIAAATASPERSMFDDDEAMGSRAGDDAAIIRLLRGDRTILPRIVARLGANDPEEERRWRTLLTGLVEALVARSIEAASFDFPTDHPFWGPFSRAQNRDIAAALASLGHRHDGFGGWAEDRVPTQRDLSLAVGYAGLDPMRIRHWPQEAEMADLLREVTVAADEYIWEAAGALTLGELISLLGRRADGLTDLWNEWGAVRPLLLAAD